MKVSPASKVYYWTGLLDSTAEQDNRGGVYEGFTCIQGLCPSPTPS